MGCSDTISKPNVVVLEKSDEAAPKKEKERSAIRFLHLRRKEVLVDNAALHELDSDDSFYAGIRYAAKGGLTCAYRYVSDDVIEVAFARCNHEDSDIYNRRIGRNLATANLVKGAKTTVKLYSTSPIESIVEYVHKKKWLRRNISASLVVIQNT